MESVCQSKGLQFLEQVHCPDGVTRNFYSQHKRCANTRPQFITLGNVGRSTLRRTVPKTPSAPDGPWCTLISEIRVDHLLSETVKIPQSKSASCPMGRQKFHEARFR